MKSFIVPAGMFFAASLPVIAATSDPAPAVNAPAPAFTGTLFYSEGERARLDRARRTGVATPVDAPEPPPPVINGVVKRSDGNTSVWIDGVMVGSVDRVLAQRLSGSSVGNPEAGLRITSSERLAVRDAAIAKPKPASKARHAKPATSRKKAS